MINQLTVNIRRLSITLAIATPLAIGAGIGWAELQWQNERAISLPEMCITAMPNGETSVSKDACEAEVVTEI